MPIRRRIRPETTAWRTYSERVRLQAAALRCIRRYSASLTRKRTVRERKVAALFRGRPPLGFTTSMARGRWQWNKQTGVVSRSVQRRSKATSRAPNLRRARRAADGSGCDLREQTGRGSPAGRGGSRWQPKTRCGVFVPREHNLAPFGFRTRDSAAHSTFEVERCGIPGSQRRQRGGAPVPANGRRFMSRQEWGACSFWPERIGACRRPTEGGGQPLEGSRLFSREP